MRVASRILLMAAILSSFSATAQTTVTAERRQRATAAFHDGIVLLHASSRLDSVGDGFRQDPYFYYFTGLENSVGVVLAIDGKSGESWLFLPSNPAHGTYGLQPEVRAGAEDAKRLGIQHVVDWTALDDFLSSRAAPASVLYYAASWEEFTPEMPSQLLSAKSPSAPLWLQIHATNLIYDYISTHLRADMTINFEPIASVDGQGFFLEDTYLIKKDGVELLTPGVLYSAEEIEAAMR